MKQLKHVLAKFLAILMIAQAISPIPISAVTYDFAYSKRNITSAPTKDITLYGMGDYYDHRYNSPNFGGEGHGRLYDLKVIANGGTYRGGAFCFDQGLHAQINTGHNSPTEFDPLTFKEAQNSDTRLFLDFYYYVTHALADPAIRKKIEQARELTQQEKNWAKMDDGKRYAFGALTQAVIWVNQKEHGKETSSETRKNMYASEMHAMIRHLNTLLAKEGKPLIKNGEEEYDWQQCRESVDVILEAARTKTVSYNPEKEFKYYIARHNSDTLPITTDTDRITNNRTYQRFVLGQYIPPKDNVITKPVYIKIKKVDDLGRPLAGATFDIKITHPHQRHVKTVTINTGELIIGGENDKMNLLDGEYTFEVIETKAPKGYKKDPTPRYITASTQANGTPQTAATFPENGGAFVNDIVILPVTTAPIVKIDKDTGAPLAGARIRLTPTSGNGREYNFVTQVDGPKLQCHDPAAAHYIEPGGYSVEEIEPPSGYEPNTDEQKAQPIEFIDEGGTTKVVGNVVFANRKKKQIILSKIDRNGKPISNAVFKVYKDGTVLGDYTTGTDGRFTLPELSKGTYSFYETQTKPGYELPPMNLSNSHIVFVDPEEEQDTYYVTVTNYKLKKVILYKKSVTGDLINRPATFDYYFNGTLKGRYPTDGGILEIPNAATGVHTFQEVNPPNGYEMDTDPKKNTFSIYVDTSKDIEEYEIDAINYRKKSVKLTKVDPQGNGLPGAIFEVYHNNNKIGTTHTTGPDGTFTLNNLTSGTYMFKEIQPPDGYELPKETIHTLFVDAKATVANNTYELRVVNHKLKTIELRKTYKDETDTPKPLSNARFEITKDGIPIVGDHKTNAEGKIILERMGSGTYVFKEVEAPNGYLIQNPPQDAQTLIVDTTSDIEPYIVEFENVKAPKIKLTKKSADEDDGQKRLENALFECYIQGLKFGEFFTDKNGEINISYEETQDANGRTIKGYGDFLQQHNIQNQSSWSVEFKEINPPDGYLLSVPASQTNTLVKGQFLTEFAFTNSKYPEIVIQKFDSATNKPLKGTAFDIQVDATKVSGSHITDEHGIIRINYKHYKAYLGNKINDKNITWTVTVTEISPTRSYFNAGELTPRVQTHDLRMGQSMTQFTYKNEPHPDLKVFKKSSKKDVPLKGVTYSITSENGTTKRVATTDETGWATFELVPEGTYTLREQDVPQGFIRSEREYTVISQPSKDGHKQILEILFANDDTPTLKIIKVNELDNCPLPDVTFNIKYKADKEAGTYTDFGDFTTDKNGEINFTTADNLKTGWYTITELKPPKGFTYHNIDGKEREIYLAGNREYIHKVRNTPLSSAQILKFDKDTKKPLKGVSFQIQEISGKRIGEFTTDHNGVIILPNLQKGWYEAIETKTLPNYKLDPTPKKFEITQNEMVKVEVPNEKKPGLQILKIDKDTKEPIPNTRFEIRTASGTLVASAVTDKDGLINLYELEPNAYVVTETKANDSYLLDTTPKTVEIKGDKHVNLTIENERGSGLLLFKVDAITKLPLQGVTFLLSDKTKKPIGEYTSDNKGRVYVEHLKDGTYYIKEIKTLDSHKIDTKEKTLQIMSGKVTTLTWENTPKVGQIQIHKRSKDDNEQSGLPEDSPLQGAVFHIYDYKTKRLLGQMTSDKEGIASSKPLPLGQYEVKEIKAPKFYKKSNKELIVTIEYENQIVKETLLNASSNVEVAINLKGVKEATCNSQILYFVKDVENKSNIELENFYWRMKLPTTTLTADYLFTGTYSKKQKYDVFITTSLGRKIQVAGNLSTQKDNYVDLKAKTKELFPQEEMSEITFVFGKVPSGFKQLTDPRVAASLKKGLISGTKFVNTVDVGATAEEEWVIQDSTWKSKFWCKEKDKLPKTGY